MHKEGLDLSRRRGSDVREVPFSDLSTIVPGPGVMFRVSGSNQPAQFIRIVEVGDETIFWEALSRSGETVSYESTSLQFQERFRDALLKFQGMMSDEQWKVFADFLGFISRRQLSRKDVFELFLFFQDMAVEREMAELRQGVGR